jgi:broad specificity phosphatase PhoE
MRSSVREWYVATRYEMTDFWLIRHGSTDTLNHGIAGRAPGIMLNAAGHAEVAALTARIARIQSNGKDVHRIYSSPLERTLATARPLASALGCELTQLDAFSELHFGEWTGMTFTDLHCDPQWQHFNLFRGGTQIPGGESMLSVQARAVQALLELRDRHPNLCVIVVSHGDVIKAVVMHFLGIALDFCARLDIAPTSITQLELHEHTARVSCINDTAHLEALSRGGSR